MAYTRRKMYVTCRCIAILYILTSIHLTINPSCNEKQYLAGLFSSEALDPNINRIF